MERDFYQTLRRIQKEERNKSALARVGNDFYKKVYSYIKDLERSIANNPFSNEEHNLLKNSQMIATEICHLREHKITESAVRNIQRSYLLFAKGRPQFDLVDTTPLNLTDEEETLYFAIIDTLKAHRSRISLDKFVEETDDFDVTSDIAGADDFDVASDIVGADVGAEEVDSDDFMIDSEVLDDSGSVDSGGISGSVDSVVDDGVSNIESTIEDPSESEDFFDGDDEITIFSADSNGQDDSSLNNHEAASSPVSQRLEEIKNAKIVTDEKYEPIEKQVANQRNPGTKTSNSQSQLTSSSQGRLDSNSQSQLTPNSSDNASDTKPQFSNGADSAKSQSSNPLMGDIYGDDQFVDLDKLNNHEEDFNQLDKFNDDLDKLIAQIPRSNKKKSKVSHSDGADLSHSKDEESQASNSRKDAVERIAVVFSEDVKSIVGIDEKIYGPFLAKDLAILPKMNAEIFIKNNKAKLVNI